MLSAFGGGTTRTAATIPLGALAPFSQTTPFPEVLAMHGAVRLQMPIAQSKQTAIGYHAAPDGALPLSPVGHQGNEGLLTRVFHKIFGGGGGQPTW